MPLGGPAGGFGGGMGSANSGRGGPAGNANAGARGGMGGLGGRMGGGPDNEWRGLLSRRMMQTGQQMVMPQQMMAPQMPTPNLGLLNRQQFTPGGLLQGYDLGGMLAQRFGPGAVSQFRY